MPVTTEHVAETVQAYLTKHPERRDDIAELTAYLAAGAELTGRQPLGHVTASGIGRLPDGRVAQIWHLGLGLWLQPGGHLEPEDETVLDAAIREFCQETGIVPLRVTVVDETPIHIAAMRVPGKDAGDVEHWHFDFRYLFAISGGDAFGDLPEDEIGDATWAAPADLVDVSLAQAVALLLGTAP